MTSGKDIPQIGKLHELILKSAGEGIYRVDLEGRGIFINSAAEKLLGYTSDEIVGIPIYPLTHQSPDLFLPPETCALLGDLSTHDCACTSELDFWRKDGTRMTVAYTQTPLHDEGQA